MLRYKDIDWGKDYKAVLFDMDGTVADSGKMWNDSIEQALAAHNVQFTPEEKIRSASIPLKKILQEKGISPDTIQKIYTTLYQLVEESIKEGKVTWRDGAKDTLAAIKIPKAIVTSSSRTSFELINEQLGIRDNVHCVITGDDVEGKYKPNPECILLACKQLGVRPQDVIVIGDQPCDVDAAKNAGADAILIRGPHTPSHVIHTRTATTFEGVQICLRELFQSSR